MSPLAPSQRRSLGCGLNVAIAFGQVLSDLVRIFLRRLADRSDVSRPIHRAEDVVQKFQSTLTQ